MRRFSTIVAIAISILLLSSISSAQQTATTSVPNLIRNSGTLKDAQGAALASTTPVGVTFAIYKQQDGGAAVWMETQNVTPDADGNYSVLLGSTTATGLPGDLFSQQEQRWLGVQVQGEAEQARVLLVSVPYAFKAHEAETLGGLPASAFVKAPPTDATGNATTDTGTAVNALSNAGNAGVTFGSGKTPPAGPISGGCPATSFAPLPNYIPIFLNPNTICNSVIFQTGFGPLGPLGPNVGIGKAPLPGPSPTPRLDVNGDINAAYNPYSYQIGLNTVLSVFGSQNLFVGVGTGGSNTGEDNTFSGSDAGFTNNTGYDNTFSGSQAGYANTNGHDNTFTGVLTGGRNTTGRYNSFFGVFAGLNSNADYNTFLGVDSGFLTITGSNNTFLGAEAGNSNVGGSYNTFSGRQAGFNNTANNGSFYGYQAGYNNTADGNSFYGYQAGFSNTTSTGNSFFGYQAGYNTANPLFSPGSGNSFFGYQAGLNNTYYENSYFGYQAGKGAYLNATGTGNTFVGYEAGSVNGGGGDPDGDYNTFVGDSAGVDNESGHDNTFVGYHAGSGVSDGLLNTFVGSGTGPGPGPRNGAFDSTCVGDGACSGEVHINDNIDIGTPGPAPETPGNFQILIGDQQTDTYIAGIYGSVNGTIGPVQVVCVDGAGKLWGQAPATTCVLSSRRFKEQIADMGDSSSQLFQLRPVTFFYKPQYDDGSHVLQYGLIAEEVAKVYPELVAYDKDGQPLTVKYQMLAPMLLNELQKQHTVVATQQDVIKTQQEQIQTQGQQIADLEQRLLRLESLIAEK